MRFRVGPAVDREGAPVDRECPSHLMILLMEEIRLTTWDGAKTLVNTGINYQAQLVSLPDF